MAVIVTVLPAAFLLTFTTPFLSTVATFLLLVFQVTNLFFAFFGKMLVINLMDLPAAICLEIPLITIFLTVFLVCCVLFLLSVSFFCSIFILLSFCTKSISPSFKSISFLISASSISGFVAKAVAIFTFSFPSTLIVYPSAKYAINLALFLLL